LIGLAFGQATIPREISFTATPFKLQRAEKNKRKIIFSKKEKGKKKKKKESLT
jgi:hypothetical protein